jgi:FMN phosphatase YigB (HAD superfamily)/DNA-binding XRE family transcriptional regulator
MDEKGLGKRLQKARQDAGLTQQQLCAQANLSFSTLTKIERGAIKAPSIFTIQSIAGALHLTLDELVGSAAKPARQLHKTRNGASFIFFDVNDCLVHYYQRGFTRLAADLGISYDTLEMCFWRYNDEVCRGNISMSDFNAKLAHEFHVPEVDWTKYYIDAVEPVQQMQDVLKWASENYKVGLLTNIMPGLVSAMKRQGILPDIAYDAIIDSSEVGAIKPEARIFEIAQAQAGVPAEEILFIDDDRANVMAAQKAGWQVMLFDDALPDESAARAREALEPFQISQAS